MVNTCGFVEQAKKDSIDALLEAADLQDDARPDPGRRRGRLPGRAVRRRARRAAARGRRRPRVRLLRRTWPAHLDAILHGRTPGGRTCRGTGAALLPLAPAERPSPRRDPGHGDRGAGDVRRVRETRAPDDLPDGLAPASGPRVVRRRLDGRPWAPLKLASGCDRRCALLRDPDVPGRLRLPAARRGARRGAPGWPSAASASCSSSARTPPRTARTSATCGCSSRCCPSWRGCRGWTGCGCPTCSRPRCGPGLVEVIAGTPGVVPYFDLSFQHAAPRVLRRMRRFGGGEDVPRPDRPDPRPLAPAAGIRSNVIVGFPGETEAELARARGRSSVAARLDVVGVFGYSDEDGTEAAGLDWRARPRRGAPSAWRGSATLVEELVAAACRGPGGRARRGAGGGDRRRRRHRRSAGPRTRVPTSTA